MVDLARQAFTTNNFGLAAEIYERTIKENGPQAELFLGLADSFARGGHFSKAFGAYTNAFRLGKVTPEKLKHLVTALIESVRQDKARDKQQQASMRKSCMFTCLICRGLLNDPITILCGHTFCRKCLERDRSRTCKVCGIVHYRLTPSKLKTNVVLLNLIKKWFADECRAAELKCEGNKYFERADYPNAIQLYSQAIALSKTDHLLFSNRAHAYASLEQYSFALDDADSVIKLRPDWPKGFYRKGVAHYGLGHYEDAVISFMQCLTLDTEVSSARDYLSKCLHKILSRLPPDDPKSQMRQQEQNPSLFQILLSNNFNMEAVRPFITMNTLAHLQQIMTDTVTQASNFNPDQASGSKTAAAQDKVPTTAYGSDQNLSEKQRCNSVPTLEMRCSPEPPHRQRSHSQSPDRSVSETPSNRKRSRNPSSSQPRSPTHSCPQKCLRPSQSESLVADVKEIDRSLLSMEDLECSLCYRLFYQPVTTPCGHVFCRQCLDRCLDHQTTCPMCKSCLAEYLAERRQTVTESVQAILQTYFCAEFMERQRVHEEEMSELAKMGLDNQHEIPVFVCTLGFPTVLCPLHIFEPRYRLMIRQCMEAGTRQFGMCIPMSENEEEFSDYGCMLEVRDVHFFPDGRSLVDTIGGRRFRVLERGKRDGYNTARVEFLSDTILTEQELQEAKALESDIYTKVRAWLDTLPGMHRARIAQHFGSLPELDPHPNNSPNGPAWAWWVVAVLPLDTRVQLALLSMASYKERLQALEKVLQYLTRHSAR